MAAKSKTSKTKNLVVKSVKKTATKPIKNNKKTIKKSPVAAKTTLKHSKNKPTSKVVSKKSKLKSKNAVKSKLVPVSNINLNKKNPSLKNKSKVDLDLDPELIYEYNQELLQDAIEKSEEILETVHLIETAPPTEQNLFTIGKFEPYEVDSTEDYMNDNQLRHFSKILEAWKQELMTEVDHTITEMKEADILSDPNDRATQEEAFNLELKTRDRERKLIKKIESALNKISEQKYGYCDTCGIEIGVRRLEARPTATLCIECKTLSEIKEKRS